MNRRSHVAWIVATALITILAPARGQEIEGRQLISIETSPLASFHVLTYEIVDSAETYSELFLAADRRGMGGRRLYRGPGSPSLGISPDERWIALESQPTPDYGTLHLFRYQGNLQVKLHDGDVERRALQALMKNEGLTETPGFSRFSCHLVAWSPDARSLLGYLDYQYVAGYQAYKFYFVYEIESRKVSLDLSAFNRQPSDPGSR